MKIHQSVRRYRHQKNYMNHPAAPGYACGRNQYGDSVSLCLHVHGMRNGKTIVGSGNRLLAGKNALIKSFIYALIFFQKLTEPGNGRVPVGNSSSVGEKSAGRKLVVEILGQIGERTSILNPVYGAADSRQVFFCQEWRNVHNFLNRIGSSL